MPSGRPPVVIELTAAEREHLEGLRRRKKRRGRDAQRARVILLASQPGRDSAVAAALLGEASPVADLAAAVAAPSKCLAAGPCAAKTPVSRWLNFNNGRTQSFPSGSKSRSKAAGGAPAPHYFFGS